MFSVSGYDMRKNLSINYDSNGIYATDLFTQVAVDTIRQHDQNRPLFMYLAHLSPHAANDNDPLQVPNDELEKFTYILDENRRKYAAMVSRLDTGIGKVVSALNDSGMLSNTIILFFCDNGAPTIGQHSNSGSNYPFRGVGLIYKLYRGCFFIDYSFFFFFVAKRYSVGRCSTFKWSYMECDTKRTSTSIKSINTYFRLATNICRYCWCKYNGIN